MGDILGQALDGLHDQSGSTQLRKTALISFIKGGSLDQNEFRLLKELLAGITLQKDIIPNLPVELLMLITDQLAERDVLACLEVSRSWNATLLSNRIVFNLADRFFPKLTWPQRSHQNEDARAKLRDDFLCHLHKRIALMDRSLAISSLVDRAVPGALGALEKNYLWDNESDFKLDGQEYSQFPPPNLPFNQKVLYSHGRIAWQPETHTLVLDSLQNKSRKIFSFSGGKLLGPEMKLAALGDKLIVATMDRHIFAWDIETGTFERKILPSNPARCTTSGSRVAIISDQDIYVWTLGVSLLDMTLPDLDVDLLAKTQFPRAYVHPQLDNVVYARQVYRNSSCSLRFMVHKFVDRRHVRTFYHDVVKSWLSSEWVNSSIEGFLPLIHDSSLENDDCYIHEFDMYHEAFSKRDITQFRRLQNSAFMFVVDDDYVVELSERHYCVQ